MKKSVLILIGLLLITGCTTISKFLGEPELKVQEVVIEDIDSEGITFRAGYIVTNPYPVGIAVSTISADAVCRDETVVSLLADEGFVIASSGSSSSSALFKVSYESIIKLAGESSVSGSLPFALDGVAGFDLSSVPYIGNQDLNIPFHFDFDVPVFRPQIRITDGRVVLPAVKDVSKALVAGGFNIIKAGVAAGKLLTGQPVAGDVLEAADLDISILFNIEIDNRNGAAWMLELEKCSIDAGTGSLVEMKQNGASYLAGEEGVALHMSAAINSAGLGQFVSDIVSGNLTDLEFSIDGKVSFPEFDYGVELPFSLHRKVPLEPFNLLSE